MGVFKTHEEYLREKGLDVTVSTFDIQDVISQQDFKQLADLIHSINKQHGFWPETNPSDRNFGEAVALMHSELSEALEEHRSGKPAFYVDNGNGKPEGWATEMVDCMIRMLDFLGAHQINIDQILLEKIIYNNSRPYKHGREY